MTEHRVCFDVADVPVMVPSGTLLTEAARLADVDINQPCGGQGRCGRCAVIVTDGQVRRRSTLRLTSDDLAAGYALACQAVVEGDVSVAVPAQDKLERRLVTDLKATTVEPPAGYDAATMQPVRRVTLQLTPPSMDDQTDDWSRLQAALRQHTGLRAFDITLPQLKSLGETLRACDWAVTVALDQVDDERARLMTLVPACDEDTTALWGVALDIGTTTVSVWLVDLRDGQVRAQAALYNGQVARGEDVISRIIYSGKPGGAAELQRLVLDTINTLIDTVCKRTGATPEEIMKITVAGNSTMMHLLLGLPAQSIRLAPFVTGANHLPLLLASEVGIHIHPNATVDCLPGVASYVGADISAGVLSSGLDDSETIALFLDVGTNGEMVLGGADFLATCACSAGPAFEGGGVLHGMRATAGAIEEVWISNLNYEPTYRVIGDRKPVGLCGSGLIALLGELLLSGVIDKGGHVNLTLPTPRVREGERGPEYVIVWAEESGTGEDIVITHVDIDNLMRAKAAIFAGFSVLADKVGVPLEMAEQVLIGGSFGKYINVEKAIDIGLLPDKDWSQFHFLGNTAVYGAYLALLDRDARTRITAIAERMTYIELSADNSFYDAFSSALFLPHTDLARFPSTMAKLAA